jgi:hypothetical protein
MESRGAHKEVMANIPDIVIKNRKEKTCIIIDVAIPADRNVIQKETGKKLKYKSLCIERQRMWNMKFMIIPVVIGATGIVTNVLKKNLEAMPGKHLRFTTNDSCSWNITHNKESTTV